MERVTDHSCVGAKLEETTRVIWKLKLHITCYKDEVMMLPAPVQCSMAPLSPWWLGSPYHHEEAHLGSSRGPEEAGGEE